LLIVDCGLWIDGCRSGSAFQDQHSTLNVQHSTFNSQLHESRLLISKGQAVSAEAEFDRVAEWSAADDLDGRPVAEAHFEQTTPDVQISAHGRHEPAASNAKPVQRAGSEGSGMIADRQVTGFLHRERSVSGMLWLLRLSFNADS
jgi:hypothetical protein